MFRTLNSILNIRGSSGANRLIFYFKKLPVIGKWLKDDIYAHMELKKTFAILAQILKVLWGFLSKFAYIGILIYWPVMLAGHSLPLAEQYDLFLHLFVLLSFVVASVSNVTVMETKRDKYVCVKLMRMPAAEFMRATMMMRGVSFFIYFLPAVILFSRLLGASFLQGVWFTLLLTAWRAVCEAFNLWVFDRRGIVLAKKNGLVWLVIGLGTLAAYLPLYLGQAVVNSSVLFSLGMSLTIVVLGALAAVYIARYRNYRSAVDAVSKLDDPLLDMGRLMKEARVKEVQTQDQEYSPGQLNADGFREKTGYAYLNAIFFSRHKRLLIQPIRRRLAIIGVCFAAGIVGMLIEPEISPKLGAYLIGGFPAFVFIMNFTSIGERVCKAMFYNCDLSLLRYGFYREKAAVLSNFKIRLIKISVLNLIPAAAICLAATLLIMFSGVQWGLVDAVILWAVILCLSLFFSVHHLFMYYIFQPYSTELNMKNPFFFIVNSIVMGICIICLNIQSAPAYFALIVLLATVLYMTTALILVYRFSSTTFRVK